MAEEERRRQRDLESAVEKTVPASDFCADGLRREMEQTSVDDTPTLTPQRFLLKTETENTPNPNEETTGLGGFGDTSAVAPKLIADQQPGGPRFRIVDEVGVGGTSRVYAVQDRSLNRTVALKLLRGKRATKPGVEQRFIHEARVTAMLEHPNVMPVHDIGTTDSGRVYFTMKNIQGVSLGDAIRAEKAGQAVPDAFQGLNGKIGIFLKVCEALSFAHDKGFVHQDVKPDNIMLGEYGEVLLLDWGCALSSADAVNAESGPAYGTPAYMSPEQARREGVDERSDVYCLGATLFHALALRHPTWDSDAERFWEKKREGAIDEFTTDEIHRVPKALRAIAMKALDPDPARRYQTVSALHRDLERFQAGQAVLAYRESPIEAFMRWYRRHRRVFWSSAAAAVIIVGVGGLLFREKLKEMLTWKPVFSEDFSTTTTVDLPVRWQATAFRNWFLRAPDTLGVPQATWVVDSGTLLGDPGGNGCFDIAYNGEIHGDLRIEWDMTGLVTTTNLNCFLAGSDRRCGYTFHVGGFNRPDQVTLTRLATDAPLERGALPLELARGVPYRFRMEREGNNIRFFIDNHKIVDYVDLDVLSGVGHQTFGFEVVEKNRVRIDNISVHHHPLPRKVSPLAAPKQFEDVGLHGEALVRYRSLRRAYPGTAIAARAMFRTGRCLQLLDSTEAALASYAAYMESFPRHSLVPQAIYQRAIILTELDRHAAADSMYALLAQRYARHPIARTALATMTERAVAELEARSKQYGLDFAGDSAILAWCDSSARRMQYWCRAFDLEPSENQFLHECADVLLGEGVRLPFDTVAARFPAQHEAMVEYLSAVRNAETLRERFPDQRRWVAQVLFEAGRYEEIADTYADCDLFAAHALVVLGRYDEALRRYPQVDEACAAALIGLGRLEDVVSLYPDAVGGCAKALFLLRRYDEGVERYPAGEFAKHAAVAGRRGDKFLARALGSHAVDGVTFLNRTLHQPRRALGHLDEKGAQFTGALHSWLRYECYFRADSLDEGIRSNALRRHGKWIRAMLDQGRYDELRTRVPWNQEVRLLACRQMGLYDSCLTIAPHRTLDCMQALLQAGRYDDILSRYAPYPKMCAQALLRGGRFEQVLRDCPDQRDLCAEALYRLGCYDELLGVYPQQRVACYKALALLEGEDTAFAVYPEQRSLHAQRLLQLGRFDELIARVPDQATHTAVALTRQNRRTQVDFDADPYHIGRRGRHEILSIWALRDWTHGKHRQALNHLGARPPVHLRDSADDLSGESHLRFGEFLLVPLLKAFDGDRGALRQVADSIEQHCRYHFAQQLYFESAYLAGYIGDTAFLAQPHGDSAAVRLELFRALRDDMRGDCAQARTTYAEILAVPFPSGLLSSHALREFLRWRLRELGGAVSDGDMEQDIGGSMKQARHG